MARDLGSPFASQAVGGLTLRILWIAVPALTVVAGALLVFGSRQAATSLRTVCTYLGAFAWALWLALLSKLPGSEWPDDSD